MATEEKQPGGAYGGRYAQGFQLYVKLSQEHKAILQCLDYILPGEFERIGAGKSHLHVLGVGSGAGEIDTQVLSVLRSSFPAVPIASDVVEPSTELTEQYKALLATMPQLQEMPFAWHTMTCAEYEKKVMDEGETLKRFDFIHMVQMLYYVDDYAATIKFFHSLLKENGKLLIVHEGANTGWDVLWKTYRKELCTGTISDYLSAGDIKVHLKSLGLRYVERVIPNTLDITECLVPGSEPGELLLDFMTEQDHFHRSLTPELRAGILALLRDKCSTVKDGRVLFDCSLSCLVISA